MARMTMDRGDHLEFALYLALHADGTARMTRTQPSCGPSERSMFLQLRVPKSIFKTPSLRADISIPDLAPDSVITAEVVQAAEKAVRDALNLDVHVTVGEPEGGS